MAQSDVVSPRTLGSAYVSEETVTFGTAGTERRMYPAADTIDAEAMQAELDRKNLRTRPFDALDPILGFKDGTVKFGYYLQPATTVLLKAATADADAAAPLRVPLRCVFGGESVAAGSQVASGSAVTGCVVDAGEGSRFPAGQLVLVTDSTPANGLQPARILTRTTDTLTWYPSLTGAPDVASAIVNTYTYYPSRTNSRSMSVAMCAAQDSAHQWRYTGCVGGLEIKLDRGALAMVNFDLKAATWTGPSALGLAITDVADPMAPPLACRNAVLYLQAQGTTTRTNYPVDSFVAKLNFGNRHIETLTGGTEGKRAMFRADGLTDTFAEITLTFASDIVPDTTWWASRTELTAMLWVYADDSNSARRSIIVDVPRCIVVGKPKSAPGADGLIKTTITLRAKLDDSTSGGGVELAEAPFRLGLA